MNAAPGARHETGEGDAWAALRLGNSLDGDVARYLVELDRQLQLYLARAMEHIPEAECLREGVLFQMTGGGKRIRAAMCTTACEIFCGSFQPALGFAAAIEHLHDCSLVHDDIADGDQARRGREVGVAHAINIGDVCIPLGALAVLEAAYSARTKVALFQVLSELGLLVAQGQCMDINPRRNDTPTAEDLRRVYTQEDRRGFRDGASRRGSSAAPRRGTSNASVPSRCRPGWRLRKDTTPWMSSSGAPVSS